MTVVFYLSAAVAVIATAMAVTRLHAVHALLYLILSLLAVAVVFFTLGAPFIAALEVIIYAGAIMVLFLFVVMTLAIQQPERRIKETLGQWLPAVILSLISFFIAGILIFEAPGSKISLNTAMATPAAFGQFVFKTYWFPVEIASFLLLIGLVGALYLGRRESKKVSEDRA